MDFECIELPSRTPQHPSSLKHNTTHFTPAPRHGQNDVSGPSALHPLTFPSRIRILQPRYVMHAVCQVSGSTNTLFNR